MLSYYTRRSLNYYFSMDIPPTPEEFLEKFKIKNLTNQQLKNNQIDKAPIYIEST